MIITKNTHPKEWAILTKYCPSYRKRRAFFTVTESVALSGRYWDGGSKTNWRIIKDGTIQQISDRQDFPFSAPDTTVDLLDGTIVIATGTFCGKTSTAHIYLYRKN